MEEIKELTREIRGLREDVMRLEVAVGGNAALGQKGHKDTLENHETRISTLESKWTAQSTKDQVEKESKKWRLWKSKAIGFGAGATATASIVAPKSSWSKIWTAITNFFQTL